jgi:hypothetical protein
MSQDVELAELLEVASGFGTVPLLLTVDASGRPRAAAVTVSWDGSIAEVRAGHRSLANARERPLVTLLWPAPPGERFALLVDGEAHDVRDDPAAAVPGTSGPTPQRPTPQGPGRSMKAGGTITLRVTSALLHAVSR